MVVAVVALIVIKPADLPKIAQMIGLKCHQVKRYFQVMNQEWQSTTFWEEQNSGTPKAQQDEPPIK